LQTYDASLLIAIWLKIYERDQAVSMPCLRAANSGDFWYGLPVESCLNQAKHRFSPDIPLFIKLLQSCSGGAQAGRSLAKVAILLKML
jgi:hypothetical protein